MHQIFSSPRWLQERCVALGLRRTASTRHHSKETGRWPAGFKNRSLKTSVEETVRMNGLKSYYEEYHGVKYSPDAIRVAAEMSAKYMHDRFLPDKAIDVIDEAGAALKLKSTSAKTKLVRTRNIETVVARMAKVPAKTVVSSEKVRLGELESKLKGVIFGQDHAIEQVVRAIKLSRSGLGQPEKPVGCFLFPVPTGVGKTELANRLR